MQPNNWQRMTQPCLLGKGKHRKAKPLKTGVSHPYFLSLEGEQGAFLHACLFTVKLSQCGSAAALQIIMIVIHLVSPSSEILCLNVTRRCFNGHCECITLSHSCILSLWVCGSCSLAATLFTPSWLCELVSWYWCEHNRAWIGQSIFWGVVKCRSLSCSSLAVHLAIRHIHIFCCHFIFLCVMT